jgi:hypothetical protein
MGDRTCFKCSMLNDCNILEIMKDVEGNVFVQVLNTYAKVCDKYFNPKEKSYEKV